MEDSDEDSMEMVPIEAVPDDRDQSHCKKKKVTYINKKRKTDFSKQIAFFPKGF